MGRRGRPPYPDILTPREWEVLALLRDGLTNEAIAARLGVTQAAAKFHVSQILSTLGVATWEEAAAWQPEAAREPQLRRRWAGVAGWLRPVTMGKAALIGAAVAVLAGLGVLAWGVLRDSGEETALLVAASPTRTPTGTKTIGGASRFATATDVWVVDADGSDIVRLTNLEKPVLAGYNLAPAWSPDGTRIAFLAGSGSNYAEAGNLYLMRADGTNIVELAPVSFDYTRTSWCESDRSPVWSP